MRSSWLCRDNFDRRRMLDMETRVRPIRQRTFLILAVAILILAPQLGWWPLAAMVPMVAFFTATNPLLDGLRRPEYLMFGAWVGGELTIAGAVAIAGGPHAAALSWLAIPVITLNSRFSGRGIVLGVAITVLLVLAVAFGVDARAVLDNPELVVAPVALVLCVAVLSTPLINSDIEHRSDAVLDELTGMLNRKALQARAQELAEQSAITGEPVGVIAADIDNFKLVNDTRGHTVGDVVLRDVADRLRAYLRAFDLAYRIGGEEFLILVPGSDLGQTEELAERLREGIAAQPVSDGLAVTMSFGVAASERSRRFDYATVYMAADAALYEAKRAGRNRACRAEPAGGVQIAA